MASKKLKRAAANAEEELKVDMSPMIDMVFLLLIFFIVASTVVIVKQDQNVDPPVAKNSIKQEDGRGRIVINVYEDGTLRTENGLDLASESDITEFVKEQKALHEANGTVAFIHLRGDKRTAFKHVRRVMRASAQAGVKDVNFSVMGFEINK
ncbi:ExbD/TolR family protein [Persicirhabdus sediminis]|uniref:Biopolymer transporter ExbD n=1 Tax=Persicirhabdus sediminis TaxID=454144 RepID=A0A8J7MCH1_9BACT|nr:biopolymer transporter ExbD [Persicirhabdus sediminis]MBK1791139.1 biopolymer transporter ExbD [Persicirhabdus sediminis]